MNKELKKIYDRIPMDKDFIPDQDLFMKTMFQLNPQGNLINSYNSVLRILESANSIDKQTVEGKGVFGFKYLFYKYDKYIEFWKNKFGDIEEKYIKSIDKLKPIDKWIDYEGFEEFYNSDKNHLNAYLFGGFTEETLRKKLAIFNQIIGKENGTEQSEIQEPEFKGIDNPKSEDPF